MTYPDSNQVITTYFDFYNNNFNDLSAYLWSNNSSNTTAVPWFSQILNDSTKDNYFGFKSNVDAPIDIAAAYVPPGLTLKIEMASCYNQTSVVTYDCNDQKNKDNDKDYGKKCACNLTIDGLLAGKLVPNFAVANTSGAIGIQNKILTHNNTDKCITFSNFTISRNYENIQSYLASNACASQLLEIGSKNLMSNLDLQCDTLVTNYCATHKTDDICACIVEKENLTQLYADLDIAPSTRCLGTCWVTGTKKQAYELTTDRKPCNLLNCSQKLYLNGDSSTYNSNQNIVCISDYIDTTTMNLPENKIINPTPNPEVQITSPSFLVIIASILLLAAVFFIWLGFYLKKKLN